MPKSGKVLVKDMIFFYFKRTLKGISWTDFKEERLKNTMHSISDLTTGTFLGVLHLNPVVNWIIGDGRELHLLEGCHLYHYQKHLFTEFAWGFPHGSVVKKLPANAGDKGDTGSISRW